MGKDWGAFWRAAGLPHGGKGLGADAGEIKMNPIHKIALAAGSAVALSVGIALVWLTLANAHLKTELAKAQALNVACRMANEEFASRIARQNKAIQYMRDEGERRKEKADAEIQKAHKAAQAFYGAAEKLRKAKVGGDPCQAADAMLSAYIRKQK